MKKVIKKQFWLWALAFILLVFAATGFWLKIGANKPTPIKPVNANIYLPQKITECFDAGRKNSCYKTAAQEFVKKYPLDTIFSVLENSENQPKIFQACHEILHFVGQAEFNSTQNVNQALKQGNPVCFAGYFHGVLEAYMSAQHLFAGDTASLTALNQKIPGICVPEGNKSYNECLHGLGHALMYASDNNLPLALKLCDNLPDTNTQQWCYSGAFMENSTSSTNPDHPNEFLKKDDPMYPCSILEKKYLPMCYTLQSFYFGTLTNYDWTKTGALCAQVPADYQDGCYNAIGQSQVGTSQDYGVMLAGCKVLKPQKAYQACILGIAGSLFERYNDGGAKAYAFCAQLPSADKQICYQRAMDTIANAQPKSGAAEICKGITEDQYHTLCLSKFTK